MVLMCRRARRGEGCVHYCYHVHTGPESTITRVLNSEKDGFLGQHGPAASQKTFPQSLGQGIRWASSIHLRS